MNNFSSTLDLPNLQGFDKGIPVQITSTNHYLKIFLGVLFFIVFIAIINSSQQNKVQKEINLK